MSIFKERVYMPPEICRFPAKKPVFATTKNMKNLEYNTVFEKNSEKPAKPLNKN
jgi:hypothetical protein